MKFDLKLKSINDMNHLNSRELRESHALRFYRRLFGSKNSEEKIGALLHSHGILLKHKERIPPIHAADFVEQSGSHRLYTLKINSHGTSGGNTSNVLIFMGNGPVNTFDRNGCPIVIFFKGSNGQTRGSQ